MAWILYMVGSLCVFTGFLYILYTDICRGMMQRLIEHVNRRLLSMLPVAIGILLLVAAQDSGKFIFISVLGSIAVIKGLLYGFGPRNISEKIFQWFFHSASDRTWRFFGILILMIGTAMLPCV